jgi:uncharacterized protein
MKKITLLNWLEIAILLILPMHPFHINLLYIILVLLIIAVSKILRKENLKEYGFLRMKWSLALLAAVIGIAFGLFDNLVIDPWLAKVTGKPVDLSAFAGVKGNIGNFLVLLAIGWVIGGFFEEFFFRGYLLNRINKSISNQQLAKWTGILLTSVVFAFAHAYQDTTGMIETFYFSILLCLLYYFFKKNVWYLVLIHALYDTAGITLIYLGKF